ncbi:hypothetical protein [Bacteroides togonis]|uniref:hypothetical protein n=1 Tax=Bacteroides togonis TaxID=1917883 RepID=UPI0013564768|nr:hypothetical protein [Bacteroides togonis]
MNKLLFIILLLNTTSPIFAQNWNKLSRKIKKEHKAYMEKALGKIEYDKVLDEDYPSIYHFYRKRLHVFQRLRVNPQNDTIYILETDADILNHYKTSTLYTRHNLLSYQFDSSIKRNKKDSLSVSCKPLYSMYMLQLATQWNLDKLKEEGEKHHPIPYDCIWLTRIVFKDGKYEIDCFYFKDFFNVKRDISDDYYYKAVDMATVLKKIFQIQ